MRYSYLIPLTILVFLIAYVMNTKTFVFTIESEPVILENREGEWRVDSIVGQKNYSSREYVFFIGNKFWRFRADACPMLIDSSLKVVGDKVYDGKNIKYTISIIDSTIIRINNKSGKTALIKTNYNRHFDLELSYNEKVKKMLIRDSLIRLTTGWWKLKNRTQTPIDLPNNSEIVYDFTLHLRHDGFAVFYVDHKLNQGIEYDWERDLHALTFRKGCIIDERELIYFDKRNLKFLSRSVLMEIDTLELIKCRSLK